MVCCSYVGEMVGPDDDLTVTDLPSVLVIGGDSFLWKQSNAGQLERLTNLCDYCRVLSKGGGGRWTSGSQPDPTLFLRAILFKDGAHVLENSKTALALLSEHQPS